jgi:hypothetical protein
MTHEKQINFNKVIIRATEKLLNKLTVNENK